MAGNSLVPRLGFLNRQHWLLSARTLEHHDTPKDTSLLWVILKLQSLKAIQGATVIKGGG